jgi:hypothetical protein
MTNEPMRLSRAAGFLLFAALLSVLLASVTGAASGRVATAPAAGSRPPRSLASAAATGSLEATPSTPATPSVVATVPSSAQIAAAVKFIKGRRGVVAFAVMDSKGSISGYHITTQFVTASAVKAMLLVGYLRTHKTLTASARSTLTSMIHVSDNNAATAIYHVVGNNGLRAVAKAAKMRYFSITGSTWGNAQLTCRDQARFFFVQDSLIPTATRAFARNLLSTITPAQSWGIPAVARSHGWKVFFKGGWRGTARGQLVHQMARLEKGPVHFSIAVMTDGDPSMAYGIATIRGVTQRMVGLAS